MQYRIGAMHIGQILDTAFEVFRDHHKSLLTITAVVFGPYMLLYFGSAFSGVWPVFKAMVAYNTGSWDQYGDYSKAYDIGLGTFIFLYMVFATFAGGALALATASFYLNKHVSVHKSIQFMLKRWWPLFKTFLFIMPLYIMSSASMLIIQMSFDVFGKNVPYSGVIFIVVMAIGIVTELIAAFVIGKLCLAINVVILEDLSSWKAIRRSTSLMKGSWWKGVILHLSNFVLVLVFIWVTQFIASDYLLFIVDIAVNIVVDAFFVVASVVLYFSTRSKHENFDIEFMAQYATA